MKLSSFLVGMFATATAVSVASLTFGGTFWTAVMLWFCTLLIAQVLYVLYLVLIARFSGDGNRWTQAKTKSVFARPAELGEGRVNQSSGPNL